MSLEIRQAAYSGSFYPDDIDELQGIITTYLKKAENTPCNSHSLIHAIIAPHAGYIYSGEIAASAYACILPFREKIRRIILLGPSHRVPFHGVATTHAQYYQTPLGNIPLDTTSLGELVSSGKVKYLDEAHQYEHSLEVQLPFLQVVLTDFTLVPLVIGDCEPSIIADILEPFTNAADTLIVISSDLSHYHTYHDAQLQDQNTAQAIENLLPEHINYEDACGRNPVNGLLTLAKKKDWKCHSIDLRNSGDTAGDKQRVVGYGAFILTDNDQ